MKIMNQVTWKYLKKNKKRTIVTILGVIISVAMITAVSTFVDSFLDMMRRNVAEREGDWHVEYLQVPYGKADPILQDGNTGLAGFLSSRQVAEFTVPGQGAAYYSYLQEYSPNMFPLFHTKLQEGRLPQSDEEICIANYVNEQLGTNYQIGDTITLSLGKRMGYDGSREYELGPFEGMEEERFVPEREKTFTITGILDSGDYRYWRMDQEFITFLDPNALTPDTPVDVVVRLNRVSADLYSESVQLGGGIANGGIAYHTQYLYYYGLVNDGYFLRTMAVMVGIVGAIILIGSVLLIYNAFAISVSERSRQLGMLSSVGATRSQKRNSVFFEGFLVGSIAIPLGIVSGILGIGITFRLVSPMMQQLFSTEVSLHVVVNWPALLCAVLFSVLTIGISIWVPARRASRITPIDAIRQTEDIKLKGKTVKTSRLTRWIFGFEGELALKNLKRQRGRYRTTILSLTVSIVLFLTASGYTHLLGLTYNMTGNEIGYDAIQQMESIPPAQTKEILSRLRGLDSVEEVQGVYMLGGSVELAAEDMTEALRNVQADPDAESFWLSAAIYSLDDDAFREYAQRVGVEEAACRNPEDMPAILVNETNLRQGHTFTQTHLLNRQAGDSITVQYQPGGQSGQDETATAALRIAQATKETPVGIPTTIQEPGVLYLVVSEPVMERLWEEWDVSPEQKSYTLLFQTNAPNQLQKDVDEALEDYAQHISYFNNLTQRKDSMSQLGTLVSVFVYGFITLITLIAVANIFNTISTSVGLRVREFAMLKSVGMTPQSFNRMICFESLFYGIKALLYGLPFSFLILLLLYWESGRNFSLSFWSAVPWVYVAAAIAGVFVIIGLTMLYSGSKVKKADIVETLTRECI